MSNFLKKTTFKFFFGGNVDDDHCVHHQLKHYDTLVVQRLRAVVAEEILRPKYDDDLFRFFLHTVFISVHEF